MATPSAGKDGGTYKTPSKHVIHITTVTTFIPYRSRDTNVRHGCGGEPIDGPVSDCVHFGWCAPTVIHACLLKMSPSKGMASHNEEWGGGFTSPSSLSSSSTSSSPPKDLGSKGVPPPRALATARAALLAIHCRHGWCHTQLKGQNLMLIVCVPKIRISHI
jgi:hypothetical protein